MILHELQSGGGGSPYTGPYTVVAAFLNRKGHPVFADVVSLRSHYRTVSLTLDGQTTAVTVSSTLPRGAGETERYRYALKDTRLVGVREPSWLIPSRGGTQVFSALEPILAFDVPDNFVVMPQFREDLSGGRLDLTAVGYPNAGISTLLRLANHTVPTDGDPDKIIRQRIGGAIEIAVEGFNYPWPRYWYRNEFRKAVSGRGVALYEEKPEKLSWRSMSLAVPIQPSAEAGNTRVIYVTVRSGDRTARDEVLQVYLGIKASLRYVTPPSSPPAPGGRR